MGSPLYLRGEDGAISDGAGELSVLPADSKVSFFLKYHYESGKLYYVFYTARGKAPALTRGKAASDFYESLSAKVRAADEAGQERLRRLTEA